MIAAPGFVNFESTKLSDNPGAIVAASVAG
jgi:hypothetical protein